MKYSSFKLYCFFSKISMKSWFQYKVDAILRSFAVFLREATAILALYLTFSKFNNINGWTLNEIIFLFSFLFLTYAIMIIMFTGLRDFDKIVNKGDLDRYLLRPRGVLFQVLSYNSDWFAAIGHGILGLILFISSANNINICWNINNILYCIMTVLGGVLIQGAIFLFCASMNFHFMNSGKSLESLLYRNGRKLAGYPISIFKSILQYFIIFVIPFAFVNYFPAQFLMNNTNGYPQFVYYITPFVGAILYFLSYFFWRVSLKKYSSSGN